MTNSHTPTPPGHELRLLRRFHEHGDVQARAELLESLMPLVHSVARRYANRGQPLEDLIQVGSIGLIKAVDRFDLDRGVKFSTFAVPNITGEIKRYFRDKAWAVRVPRDLKERSARLSAISETFSAENGRAPTVAELASAAGVSDEEALEGIQCASAYTSDSLNRAIGDEYTPMDLLADTEDGYDAVDRRSMALDGFTALAARERHIVKLRFFDELTQAEIAEQTGISQMHVSRLLRKSLEDMRAHIENEDVGAQDQRRLRAV
jgi:RNA polymerase sigma-B factor